VNGGAVARPERGVAADPRDHLLGRAVDRQHDQRLGAERLDGDDARR